MKLSHLLSALVIAATPLSAPAAVLYTASNGTLSAQASFDIVSVSGTQFLEVVLTNTSGNDVVDAGDVLTALFFDLPGDPTLSRDSAQLGPFSSVIDCTSPGCTQPTGGDVAVEWAYANNLSGAPNGANSGISSSGLNLFGPGDRFSTSGNLSGPPSGSLGGADYGITSAGDNPATTNGSTAGVGLIQNQVVFLLDIPTGTTISLLDISNVSFQYGTDLTETNLPGACSIGCIVIPTPEPGSLALFGLGGVVLALVLRKRRR